MSRIKRIQKKKPIVKLLDMRYANLGDHFASIMAYDFLGELGIPICGGDIKELNNTKDVDATHLLVWGGGTIYETETGTDGPINTWNLFEDAKKMNVLFVGPGFNGVSTQDENILSKWKYVFDKASLVSLRDRESIEECSKVFNLNITEKYHHHPDPSFLCKKYINTNVPKIDNLIAYSPKTSHFTLENQIQIINEIRKHNMNILFITHSELDYRYLKENNLVASTDYLFDLRSSPLAVTQLLASVKLHITARLHGMTMSTITGVPFIHIDANTLKIFWQLEEMNMTKYKYVFENPNAGLLNNYPTINFGELSNIISEVNNDKTVSEELLEISKDIYVAAEKHLIHTKEILLQEI